MVKSVVLTREYEYFLEALYVCVETIKEELLRVTFFQNRHIYKHLSKTVCARLYAFEQYLIQLRVLFELLIPFNCMS